MRSTVLPLPLLFFGVTGAALAQPGRFTATGNMTTARVGHSATLLPNGKVLIAGGSSLRSSRGTVWDSAELYDPATGAFTATGMMTTRRLYHTATLLPDGRVLLAGGVGDTNGISILASTEFYDPVTGTFAAATDMTAARVSHTATLLNNGKVLIAGGGGLPGAAGYSAATRWASAELYDPSSATFSITGSMTEGRAGPTVTTLANGKVLIAGGDWGVDHPNPNIEVYDPDTGVFSLAGGTTPVGVTGPVIASLLPNGQVLVAMVLYDSPTMAAQVYDPSTRIFTVTGQMTAPRTFTATLLPAGTVLIAGHPVGGGSPTADVYDPGTGTFAATGDMATPRVGHTATLLSDGRVLITGGVASWNSIAPILDAELYRPAVLTPAPVLFSLSPGGRGQGAILHPGTAQSASSSNPAAAGAALEIYCAGLLDGSVIPPQVAIGGRMAEILFFGNAPGYLGLNQVNVRVPGGVAPGPAVPVRLTYLGRPSNEVTIGVQ